MKKIALALASLSVIALAAPSIANAETVIIKRGGHHHHGWDRSRAEYRIHRAYGPRYVRPHHRHHDRTVIIKRY
ncbi:MULTISPECIES: hypothetical protein [unclassified Bradyrhizobium]|uniref:hypothetical protein n=1 Tax=unclassified Bradyrhizobium TaxID=2631580 RepID=UPI0028E5F467|nr:MULTISPECIES: hypothetical protein [unclassified Bradyrhizobium]